MRNKKGNISISNLKMRNHTRERDMERKSRRCRHNIKLHLEETLFESGGWIEKAQNKGPVKGTCYDVTGVIMLICNLKKHCLGVTQNKYQWKALVTTIMNLLIL
jgi:hypothetical protein